VALDRLDVLAAAGVNLFDTAFVELDAAEQHPRVAAASAIGALLHTLARILLLACRIVCSAILVLGTTDLAGLRTQVLQRFVGREQLDADGLAGASVLALLGCLAAFVAVVARSLGDGIATDGNADAPRLLTGTGIRPHVDVDGLTQAQRVPVTIKRDPRRDSQQESLLVVVRAWRRLVA
jgi:hypothetical protein